MTGNPFSRCMSVVSEHLASEIYGYGYALGSSLVSTVVILGGSGSLQPRTEASIYIDTEYSLVSGKMVMEQYLSEITDENVYNHNEIPLKCKTVKATVDKAEENPPESMDCSICLELVQDPVVTFCGHLYCWPCIYKWIRFQSEPSTDSDQQQPPQCPVCKAEISEETVIPLYGKGLATEPSKGKVPHLGLDIPQRPQSPRGDSPLSLVSTPTAFASRVPQLSNLSRTEQPQPYSNPNSYMASPAINDGPAANIGHPAMAMLGEMVYGRIFGNSQTTVYAYPNSYNVAGSNNPRIRRHMMESDKSLSRLTFFLMCCMLLCLLFF